MVTKIKSFIKSEWKFLIFIALLYLTMTYELPYVIYTPGGHINMSERVSGEDIYEEEGSLSMTYVSMVKGTIPFLALSKVIPNWDIVKKEKVTYDNTSFEETVEIDKIQMKEAISNAEFVAYTKAGIDFEVRSTHNLVINKSNEAKTNISFGDEIISVDGNAYTTLENFQKYISTMKQGDKIELEYERKGKKLKEEVELIQLDGKTKVGLSIVSIAEYETIHDIEVKTKSSESGPSGGLITALEIYNKIVPSDITRGRKIMGTGTIDKEGNVGEIGGVKYKLLGAYDDGAEVFICPKENYEEALEVKKAEDMAIILIGVETFDEALEALKK